MDFNEWMEKNEITQADLARRLNVYPNQINNILRGKHKPSVKMCIKIKEFTKGAVTIDDLLNIKPCKTIKFKVNQFVITESDLHDFIKQKAKEAVEEIMQQQIIEKKLGNIEELERESEFVRSMSLRQTATL